jgi:hypothetical protein
MGWLILSYTQPEGRIFPKLQHSKKFESLIFVLLLIFIGFRYQVGGDWKSYLKWYGQFQNAGFNEVLKNDSPAYTALNWVAFWLLKVLGVSDESSKHLGIYFVNFVCALIFLKGLAGLIDKLSFTLRVKPLMWIWSYHYLIVAVAMGYTRQATALGCFMIGLKGLWCLKTSALDGTSHFKATSLSVMALSFAPLFHFSIIPLLMILATAWLIYACPKKDDPMPKVKLTVIGLTLGVLGLLLFIQLAATGNLIYERIGIYIFGTHPYHSKGALPRLLITSGSALLILAFVKTPSLSQWLDPVFKTWAPPTKRFWILISMVGSVLFPAGFFWSTFADRFGLFFIPLQLLALTFLYSFISQKIKLKNLLGLLELGLILISGMLLWGWLQFSDHAQVAWLPYKNLFF